MSFQNHVLWESWTQLKTIILSNQKIRLFTYNSMLIVYEFPTSMVNSPFTIEARHLTNRPGLIIIHSHTCSIIRSTSDKKSVIEANHACRPVTWIIKIVKRDWFKDFLTLRDKSDWMEHDDHCPSRLTPSSCVCHNLRWEVLLCHYTKLNDINVVDSKLSGAARLHWRRWGRRTQCKYLHMWSIHFEYDQPSGQEVPRAHICVCH